MLTAKNKRNRNDLNDVADYKQSAYVSKLLEGGGGVPGDVVPTAHSYRNPLSHDFPGGGGGVPDTPPPMPKDGAGLSSRSLNKAST